MNVKILKNLILYSGSPRRASSAPRDDGVWGCGAPRDEGNLARVVRLLKMHANEKLLESVRC